MNLNRQEAINIIARLAPSSLAPWLVASEDCDVADNDFCQVSLAVGVKEVLVTASTWPEAVQAFAAIPAERLHLCSALVEAFLATALRWAKESRAA